MIEHNQLKHATAHDQRLQKASRNAREQLKQAVNQACNNGLPETQAAQIVGVTRLTIRHWRGKNQHPTQQENP